MRHRSRALAISLIWGLLVGACTDTAGTTTTVSAPAVSTSIPATTPTTSDPLYAIPLPEDPDVVTGELDNGVTYYIRENDSPGGRAELRLLVDVGSVQEDPDQAGLAHFLEHMMFNGTERFPRNELIAVLEGFGPRFGPDINASTSYDETIYELGLSTDDPELVELGVEVLREWATRATLTEADVVEERGVILDEWRLRAQGFSARVTEQLEQLILPGTVYEGHQPIGTAESIRTMTPDELRRFYDNWYHPERMAVVAVGDFETARMEWLIDEAFGDIPRVADPPVWHETGYEPPTEPRASSYVDEEATLAEISALWPVPSPVLTSVGDYRDSLATSFGLDVIAQRLRDDAASEDGPLLDATVIDFDWTRTITALGVDAEVRAHQADEGLERVLSEIERVRRLGVGDAEFQRALNAYSAQSEQVFEERESLQDAQLADQIVAHHLTGGHLMSPRQRFEVEMEVLAELEKTDIDHAVGSLLRSAPTVLALGPDDVDLDIPPPERILELIEETSQADLVERSDSGDRASSLMMPPDAAPVVSRSRDPNFLFTTLEFDNGATVYLWESEIAAGTVYTLVEGFGGTSLVPVDDLAEADLVAEIVSRSGVGDFPLTELRRLLSDRIVGVQPWISETRQGLEGSASSRDIEWLFQLLYLTMSRPRFSPTAVDAVLDEMETLNASRRDLPDILFEEAIDQAYYGDDPRYFVVPSSDQLAEFDVATAERVYRDAFDNAADFAFVFVGDFETRELADLAARYIGNLPGGAEPSGYVDHQPLPPREVQVLTVEAGSGEQGQLGLFFTNEFAPALVDEVNARLLELIVSARLRDRIREGLSATYSIFAGIDLQRDPDPFAEAFVLSTGDPAALDVISEEIVADLADLQDRGPSPEEFATAVAQLLDDLRLIDNPTLADALVTAHLYPDQPVTDPIRKASLLSQLGPGDVAELARTVFDLDQRIEVRQVPRP
jgi:zinc protease